MSDEPPNPLLAYSTPGEPLVRRLLGRWLAILLVTWLGSVLFLLLVIAASFVISEVFVLANVVVFFAWPIVLARATVGLTPQRVFIFLVLPAHFVITTITAYVTILMVFGLASFIGGLSPSPQLILDAVGPAVIFAIFATILSTGAWLFTPRSEAVPRFYTCAKCGYQLQGSLHALRCPECGHVLELGLDYPYLPQHLQALEHIEPGDEEQEEEEMEDPQPEGRK